MFSALVEILILIERCTNTADCQSGELILRPLEPCVHVSESPEIMEIFHRCKQEKSKILFMECRFHTETFNIIFTYKKYQ